MAESGETWEVGKSDYHERPHGPAWSKGQDLAVPLRESDEPGVLQPHWPRLGVEIPRFVGMAPRKLVKVLWG